MGIVRQPPILYAWPAPKQAESPLFNNISAINQYLHYSYSISAELALPFYLDAEEACLENTKGVREVADAAALTNLGAQKLQATMERTFNSSPTLSNHIVPISGGLDSRAILAWLTQNVDIAKIVAVTFGTPGTWDFEIGKLVAKKAGVRSELIDLSQVEWKTEDLVSFARLCERPLPIFESYLFHTTRALFGTESVYWSGFMGDPLAGSHLLQTDNQSWAQARQFFAARNCFSRSMKLTPPDFSPTDCLAKSAILSNDLLTYDEQLDFSIRQQYYIKPLVLLPGFTYSTPFLHPEWVNFILRIPRQWREKQRLYKAILQTTYPDLFALPTKTNYGLPLHAPRWRKAIQIGKLRCRAVVKRFLPWVDLGVSSQTNYIDFDHGLRNRADLQQVVYENIQALKKRGVIDWLDIDAIWQRHQKRQANHADALILLASLEIHLQVAETAV